MTSDNPSALAETITGIERSYEFMLAYAAQGRDFEDSSGSGPAIRQYLTRLREGLATIASLVEGHASEPGKGPVFASYVDVIRIDAEKARAAVDVVLSLPSIGSQLVDNLNASIHLRAVLTDVFLVDEALKSARRVKSKTD